MFEEEKKTSDKKHKDYNPRTFQKDQKRSESNSEDKKMNDSLEEVFHDALDFIPSDS